MCARLSLYSCALPPCSGRLVRCIDRAKPSKCNILKMCLPRKPSRRSARRRPRRLSRPLTGRDTLSSGTLRQSLRSLRNPRVRSSLPTPSTPTCFPTSPFSAMFTLQSTEIAVLRVQHVNLPIAMHNCSDFLLFHRLYWLTVAFLSDLVHPLFSFTFSDAAEESFLASMCFLHSHSVHECVLCCCSLVLINS